MNSTTVEPNPKPLTRGGIRPPVLAGLLFLLALLGSSYLAWAAFSDSPIAGCGTGSGCDKVMGSRWAYWLNIPVSAPAALTSTYTS